MEDGALREFRGILRDRLSNEAGREAIDADIWKRFGVERAVIFTDLGGFSLITARRGILHFLMLVQKLLDLTAPCIAKHEGELLKVEGDSCLIVFPSALAAAQAAVEMQQACATTRGGDPDDELRLCVGIGFGKILRVGGHEVFGHEVNSASKLGEDTADHWEILTTDAVRTACEGVYRFERFEGEVKGSPSNHRLLYR